MATSRILVIWYSQTGTTRQVGKSLTAALHCDGEEILEDISRGGMLGICDHCSDHCDRSRPALQRQARIR